MIFGGNTILKKAIPFVINNNADFAPEATDQQVWSASAGV